MRDRRIEKVAGTAVDITGDDIDTDRIVPARYLRCVTFDGLGDALFRDERFDNAGASLGHPIDHPDHLGATILVAGRNFGCGSSREHAPQAIRRAGFVAVIALSFAEIFFANALTIGLLCATAPSGALQALRRALRHAPRAVVSLDVRARELRFCANRYPISLPNTAAHAFIEGRWDPLTELLQSRKTARDRLAALPYSQWTRP